MTAKPAPKLTELLFLAIIGHLSKISFTPEIDDLMAKKAQDHVDNHTFLLGILTLLKQYPDPITEGVVEYTAQYTRSFVAEHSR